MKTATETRSEIKGLFEKASTISSKYNDLIITDGTDKAEVERLLGEITNLEARLAELDEAEGRQRRIRDGMRDYSAPAGRVEHPDVSEDGRPERRSLGNQFIDDESYKRLLQIGAFNSENNPVQLAVQAGERESLMHRARETRALIYSGPNSPGGDLVLPDFRPGMLDILSAPLSFLDLVPTTPTTSDTISYVVELTRTNNAAMVAEATATTGTSGLKPESGLTFDRLSSAVRTLATWMPVTNRMLADAPAIRGLIDSRLLLMYRQSLEAQILSGDGTGENLLGVLNVPGVPVLGRGADNNMDAIYKAMTTVMVTGLVAPDVTIIHPLNWQTIRLARENAATGSQGGYLMGPPALTGASSLWGQRVVLSTGIPVNSALVGSMALGMMYFEREGAIIRTGLINDQFIRNMQTILVEGRGTSVVFRPTAFCEVTGLN